jgi:hypothetical protein
VSRWEEPAGDDKLIALQRTAVTSEAVAEQVQATRQPAKQIHLIHWS